MVLSWSSSQRRVMLGLLVALVVYGFIRYTRNPLHIGDPPSVEGARAGELMDRIDPNVADAATLSALPLIGPNRARDIVEYREKFLHGHPNERAFKKLSDLTNVEGIGPATVESLEEFLIFLE